MIILVLVEEIDQALGITLGILNSCGFETRVVEKSELNCIGSRFVILGKHPQKKHNGNGVHRRRFALYRYRGFRAIGYAKRADKEMDHIWWRDLFYKLRYVIKTDIPESESLELLMPMERLRSLSL